MTKYAELSTTAQQLIDTAITARTCHKACKESRAYAMANRYKGEEDGYLKATAIVDDIEYVDACNAMTDRILATGKGYLLTA